MTERTEYQPYTQPHEPGVDELQHMPSAAIFDGITTGAITNPEALRAYFLTRRTEYLAEHPDREGELSSTGELARWHGLIYSETDGEYRALADFCDDELDKRRANETPEQARDQSYLAGQANLRHIAEAWRARVHEQPDHAPPPTKQRAPTEPPALPRLIINRQSLATLPRLVIGERPQLPPERPDVPRLIIQGRPARARAPIPRRIVQTGQVR